LDFYSKGPKASWSREDHRYFVIAVSDFFFALGLVELGLSYDIYLKGATFLKGLPV
jgi:hypothetical protein